MIPVLLDVGHSIDDFFAVALAACSPELELLGVTTAQDDGGLCAGIISVLLRAYGRADVPVVAGAGSHHEQEFIIKGTKALGTVYDLPRVEEHDGARHFLNDMLAQRAHVTVVATGPLTNVAALLRQYPQRAADMRELFFMGGWTTQALPDYNVRIDPEAVAYVLGHDIRFVAIGYEVTRGLRLLPPYIDRLAAAETPGARLLATLVRTWCQLKMVDTIPIPDPVAVAYLCNRLPAKLETIRVRIMTAPGPSRGTMYPDNEHGRQIRMFTRIDAAGYNDFLFSRLVPQHGSAVEAFDPTRWKLELHTAYQLDHYPGWALADAKHSSHIVALVLAGEGEATVDGNDVPLAAGSVLYVPPNTARTLKSDAGMSVLWFYFDASVEGVNGQSVSLTALPWPVTFDTAPDTEFLASTGRRIVKYWQYARPEGPLLCNAALIELVAHLHSHTQTPPAKRGSSGEQAAQRAKRWIETRVTAAITLDDVAGDVALDKFHLLRVFKEAYGVTPLQYQRQLRMRQAHKLLQHSELSIAEIATGVGYASATAFSRAFRREYGVPPSAVREP